MTQTVIHPDMIQRFRRSFYGRLVTPDNTDYDSIRQLWNGMIDKRPALIARCACEADVSQTIQFARSQELPIAIRGGGHSIAGLSSCDDGIMLDLSCMKGINIDPKTRTARIQAGLTLGEFIQTTQQYGLATTTGIISDTGVAGLTLGGGMGWLMGKCGLAVDNVRSVKIVTADGEEHTASQEENADLFWGVRGGSSNFGVVTNFEFQLHPVATVLSGMIVHPIQKAGDVLRFYREFTSNLPDELIVYLAFGTTPDGHPVAMFIPCYYGSLEEGARLIQPLRSFGPPIMDIIHPMSYMELLTMLDAGAPRGRDYYEKGSALQSLSDKAIDAIAEYGANMTSPFSQVIIQHVHGAPCRVPTTATAVSALREEQYVISIVAAWDADKPDAHRGWARALYSALEPYGKEEIYVNLLNDDREDRVRASYGVNYERLVELKNAYDPDNFFHFNQNIRPARK